MDNKEQQGRQAKRGRYVKPRRWAPDMRDITDVDLEATEQAECRFATQEEREVLHDMFACYWGGRPMITIPPMR